MHTKVIFHSDEHLISVIITLTMAMRAVHAQMLQSCPTLCAPLHCSLPGPWDSPGKNTRVDCHALPSPGDLPNPGIEPASLMSPALAGGLSATSTTWEAPHNDQPHHCYPSIFEKAGPFISQHNVNLKLKSNFSYTASHTLLWS